MPEDLRLSQETAAAALTGAELVYVVQGGNSRRTTAQLIADLAAGTDLSYDAATRLLSSSTGEDVTLPLATDSLAGLMAAADKLRIDQLGADDSPSFAGLTITGPAAVIIPHIHGDLAGSVYIHVKNTSGGELAKGAPVRVVGAVGDTTTLEVAAADAASAGTMPAIGILAETLAQNASGHAVVAGELTGLATGSYSVGQALYVASGGGLTGTKPTSGTIQQVAIVGRVNADTGSVTVTIGSGVHPVAYSGAYSDLSGKPSIPAAADATPQPLGTAAIGTSSDYAREDHVHAMPSAADVGADPTGAAASAISTHVAAADPHPGYALESSLGNSATRNVGTAAGTVAAGDDARFHDAVTLAASMADVLDLSGQELRADDPGADRILFWDDSEGKLRHLSLAGGLAIDGTTLTVPVEIGLACSDETTALTTGTAKVTFRLPYAMTLTAVRASVTTAPTGSTLVVDINEGGTSVLSTKLSIDATETTSTTAATAAVISDSALADDAKITIDIDQVGATIAGAGLKVWLIGRRA